MSRQRSGRGSTTGATRTTGARTGARPGVFVQAPRSDIYVTLLGIALGAMVIGSILLALILARYDFKVKATALPAAPAAATAIAA
jgi:hypothetical protein